MVWGGLKAQRLFVETPKIVPVLTDGFDALPFGFTAFGLRTSRFDFLFFGIIGFLTCVWRKFSQWCDRSEGGQSAASSVSG